MNDTSHFSTHPGTYPLDSELWRTPDPSEIREVRLKNERTQGQLARILGVSERHLQRWESGEKPMPPGMWLRLKMTRGSRFPADFEVAIDPPAWNFDPSRDSRRQTILNGDLVHLKSIQHGTLIEVRVWLDRTDGLIDDNSFRGKVVNFPDAPQAGPEHGRFYIGEVVTFSMRNVLHVQQHLPLVNVDAKRKTAAK